MCHNISRISRAAVLAIATEGQVGKQEFTTVTQGGDTHLGERRREAHVERSSGKAAGRASCMHFAKTGSAELSNGEEAVGDGRAGHELSRVLG